MTVKTITIKTEAYNALNSAKEPRESFSEVILRITKRRPLSEFFGVLSKETADELEKNITESRNIRNKSHQKRMEYITKSFKEN